MNFFQRLKIIYVSLIFNVSVRLYLDDNLYQFLRGCDGSVNKTLAQWSQGKEREKKTFL